MFFASCSGLKRSRLCNDRIILVTFCRKQVSMRLGLSERVAIEAGIYRRDSLAKNAKDSGISRKFLPKEIQQNRILAPAAKLNGKDCRFASECTRQCVCGDNFCKRECVFCRKMDHRTFLAFFQSNLYPMFISRRHFSGPKQDGHFPSHRPAQTGSV